MIVVGFYLDNRYVRRLESFRTLFDFEFDLIALVQALITVAGNSVEVDEYVFSSGAAGNESESFCCVEPFDCSFFHGTHPFVYMCNPNYRWARCTPKILSLIALIDGVSTLEGFVRFISRILKAPNREIKTVYCFWYV
jgi:hypothetical protein